MGATTCKLLQRVGEAEESIDDVIMEVFESFDTDGNGLLDAGEFSGLFPSLFSLPTPTERAKKWRLLVTEGSQLRSHSHGKG